MKMNKQDIGAALMAWYADCIEKFPEGLVTQSQAATMLGVSRVAVNRLIARGHVKAVYFPKPPDIEGLDVGHDDPTWKKLLIWFDGLADPKSFPKAIYVSFADVVRLWQTGNAKEKCKIDWWEILMKFAVFPSQEETAIEYYANKALSDPKLDRDEKTQ